MQMHFFKPSSLIQLGLARQARATLAFGALCLSLASLSAEAQQPLPAEPPILRQRDPNSDSTPAIVNPGTPGAPTPRPTVPDLPRMPAPPSSAPTSSPALPANFIDRIDRLLEQGNFSSALDIINSYARDNGETPRILLLRARVFCSQRRFDECLRQTSMSIERDPQLAEAYLFRARIFAFSMPRIDANRQAAMKDFAEAQRLAPTAAPPPFFLGLYHLEVAGDLNVAIEHFDRALKLEPNYRRAHARKVTALYENGQLDRAFEAAELAIKQVPNAPEPLAVRALINISRGNREQAERDLKTAQSLAGGFDVTAGLGFTALAANRAFDKNGSIVSTKGRP